MGGAEELGKGMQATVWATPGIVGGAGWRIRGRGRWGGGVSHHYDHGQGGGRGGRIGGGKKCDSQSFSLFHSISLSHGESNWYYRRHRDLSEIVRAGQI